MNLDTEMVSVRALEILDSRGNPTIEAEVSIVAPSGLIIAGGKFWRGEAE